METNLNNSASEHIFLIYSISSWSTKFTHLRVGIIQASSKCSNFQVYWNLDSYVLSNTHDYKFIQ